MGLILAARNMWPAFRLLGIGWFVALVSLGGGLAGYGLDGWLNSSPVFTLIGIFSGVLIAVAGMYRMLMAVLADEPEPKDRGEN